MTYANVLLLLLVVPVALAGRRWGPRGAAAGGGIALGLLAAQTLIWGRAIGIVGDISGTTVFVTVAALAGACHTQRDRGDSHATYAERDNVAPGAWAEALLSPRELEVLSIIAEGATNTEISKRLFIAETTVQTHVKHILEKLRARNRTEAAAHYLRRHEPLDSSMRQHLARPSARLTDGH